MARDGYLTKTGRRIPGIIHITDFDRATRSQAEFLRLLLDTIEGRIPRPDGGTWPVFPGTVFVVTGNTVGQGDETGRYVSANIIDSSIISRFNVKLNLAPLDWQDEEPVIAAKFPLFAEKMKSVLFGTKDLQGRLKTGLGIATATLREKINANELDAEFSHRELCNWVEAAEILLRAYPRRKDIKDVMRRAGRVVFDGFPDTTTKLKARRLIHAHIEGGMLDTGEKPGVEKGPLA